MPKFGKTTPLTEAHFEGFEQAFGHDPYGAERGADEREAGRWRQFTREDIGKLVWNRQRFIKDPDTGKRQARPNPESEWVIQDAPELRIVEDDLWSAVKRW